ncbi:MAG: glycosyltransferase [Lachnospiraceae bacterium]|nr:glycosyltransferase [Lachnospiraceae bacterium]
MLFSIVTVVLNARFDIEKTINSIRNQSFYDYEYLIIDGGSTDGTLEYIKSKALDDSRISYISEKDNGIYNAMNKGILMAKGKYILFMGAGDTFYHENVLSKVAKFSGADIIYGYGFYSSGEDCGKRVGYKMNKIDILLDRCVAHQATYVKTDIMKKYGFDEQYATYADQDFLIHMYKIKKSFCYINEPLCYYDGNGFSSLEENRKKYLDDHLRILKCYYPALFFLRLCGRKVLGIISTIKQARKPNNK